MKNKEIKKITSEERCIFCGKILPEGYGHVCKECEKKLMPITRTE